MTNQMFITDQAITDPKNPAFLDIYDDYAGGLQSYQLSNWSPVVIGSPKKTGKTTQAHCIHDKHRRLLSGSEVNFVELKSQNHNEDEFKIRLKHELDSDESSSLLGIIKASKRLKKEEHYVLVISDTHELPNDTIRWLLSGIRAIHERDTYALKKRVQIIIDGSFCVDTLTLGPNSEFPMSQIYPREFTHTEQIGFMERRLRKFRLGLSREAYLLVWEITRGDKYFTQALSSRIAELANDSASHIDESALGDLIEDYLEEPVFADSLRPFLSKAFYKLGQYCNDRFIDPIVLVSNIKQKWDDLPREIRAIAYDGGIVRRENETDIELRSPIILKLLELVLPQARHVESILSSFFSLSAVRPDYVMNGQEILDEVLGAVYMRTLRTLHVGSGYKISTGEVRIKATVLGHGIYEGTWTTPVDESISIGDEVWGFMWTSENELGEIGGQVRILPYGLK